MGILTGIKQFVESVDKVYMRRVKRASEIVEYGMHHHGHGHDEADGHGHDEAESSHSLQSLRQAQGTNETDAHTQAGHQHADDAITQPESPAPVSVEQQEQVEEEDDDEGTVISNVPLGTLVPRFSRPEQEKK